MECTDKVKKLKDSGVLSNQMAESLLNFFSSYQTAIEENQGCIEDCTPILNAFLERVLDQINNPYTFPPYHQRVIEPFDFYRFGIDILKPLVKLEDSQVLGLDQVDKIASQLSQGENVILFANHQTEPDPQAISLLLEKTHPKLAEEMIFVAGHRVVTDPLAVPFSKGRNLFCIYSKNYIEHPPEQKQEKVSHNQSTMKKMREVLSEGGKCVYVAPSGGRDRRSAEGIVEVAPFNPQSVEMFWFTAKKAHRPTHFYPLALSTFDLLPPPNHIKVNLGEQRHAQCTPIHLGFGPEIDMTQFPGSDNPDKKERRQHRTDFIWNLVKELYNKL